MVVLLVLFSFYIISNLCLGFWIKVLVENISNSTSKNMRKDAIKLTYVSFAHPCLLIIPLLFQSTNVFHLTI